MLNKIINFIKYNNASVVILVLVFLLGASAFASETGQEVIGKKKINIEGIDNTLLLNADLDNLDMKFKIEKIKEDQEKYYVTYTFIDLTLINNAWQYQIQEKIRPVSKKSNQDLGLYLAEELGEEYEARVRNLKEEKEKFQNQGVKKRTEVIEYSGLIGGVLNITGKIFPNYEPIKKIEMVTPVNQEALNNLKIDNSFRDDSLLVSPADNLTEIYNDYIKENDSDHDNIFSFTDNCPTISNPDQLDSDNDNIGDACDIDNITSSPGEAETPVIEESAENSEAEFDPEFVEIIDLDDINLAPELDNKEIENVAGPEPGTETEATEADSGESGASSESETGEEASTSQNTSENQTESEPAEAAQEPVAIE